MEKSGHDNRTFRLGSGMSLRLPSGAAYAPQIEKELLWLPKLSPFITLPISCPLAQGSPSRQYPYPWSVNKWLAGDTACHCTVPNLKPFASALAGFLRELQTVDASDGPAAGKHNFLRGGDLSVYHNETQTALKNCRAAMRAEKLVEIWNLSLQSKWDKKGVWIHGDIAPGNLLVNSGALCAVIDFGMLGIGDPACDYAIAWTFFDTESRDIFLEKTGCDSGTRNRARGWALWKALITLNDPERAADSLRTIGAILEEYGNRG